MACRFWVVWPPGPGLAGSPHNFRLRTASPPSPPLSLGTSCFHRKQEDRGSTHPPLPKSEAGRGQESPPGSWSRGEAGPLPPPACLPFCSSCAGAGWLLSPCNPPRSAGGSHTRVPSRCWPRSGLQGLSRGLSSDSMALPRVRRLYRWGCRDQELVHAGHGGLQQAPPAPQPTAPEKLRAQLDCTGHAWRAAEAGRSPWWPLQGL